MRIQRLHAIATLVLGIGVLCAPVHAKDGKTYKHLAIREFEAASDLGLPPDFKSALDRHLVEQLLKTGRFINVTLVETGAEPPADADVVLTGKIERFKKGNRAARYMVPGLGATSIKAHVEFIDPATKTPLCQDDVHGKVIIGVFGGDSKGATNGMAKGVAKTAKKRLP
jgi:Domain of unknown function (DUF4410)